MPDYSSASAETDSFEDERMCFSPVQELAGNLSRGFLSARELTEVFLRRIERIDPHVNAYVTVLAEQAIEAAIASDRRRSRGESLGMFDGLPVSVKDVEPMAGVRFTMGLQELANHVDDFEPRHVRTLRSHGAVILGKTNTPEMGHKGTTDNMLFGATRNAVNQDFNAGGSSGGAAAATAAGLASASQGSDGGGSLRIPAAMSGIVGYKVSALRIAEIRRPHGFQATTPFQTIGMLGRNVSDTRLWTEILVGHDPRDPFSSVFDVQPGRVSQSRVAFDPAFGNFPVSDLVLDTIQRTALKTRLGRAWRMTTVALPDHSELAELWRRLISVQTAVNATDLRRLGVDLLAEGSSIPPELRALIELGLSLSAVTHARDGAVRTRVLDAVEDQFAEVDLLVTPTLTVDGVENGERGRTVGPSSVAGRPVESTIGWTMTFPLNFTGHPAISVPIGKSVRGLPVGIQIIGRRGEDRRLLDYAQHLEAELAEVV
jgi:amidase/aspartyl-tRNA(Asn)/glutamyl-tRNA(Gln) amidotransferase subunit A